MGNYKIGDKLQYGQYPEIIGGKIVQIPIDWTIVKTRKDGSAIAIADKVIDCCAFDKIREILDDPAVIDDIPRDIDGKQITMWSLIQKKGMPPTRLVRYCCEVLKENNGC